MPEWFEEWFNTDEYLDVYSHRDELEAEQLVSLILSNIDLPSNARVLDLACGSGRHAIEFAKEGYDVIGIDLSENLLQLARKRAVSLGLEIKFLKSDLRELDLNSNFDLIVNLFTSFGYFETDTENYSVLNTVYSYLKPNGYFVLDFFNKSFVEKNLNEDTRNLSKGLKLFQKRYIEQDRVIKKIVLSKNNERREFVESVRLYSYKELVNFIQSIGLKLINTFGNFEGAEYDSEKSPRIILISQK